METIFAIIVILFNTAISLGVGGSSIVIASFLTALADGKIDESERSQLGVIYITLRIAMVAILLTLGYISLMSPETITSLMYIWILVAVLYINAILMTKHWISSKIGPAVQAATWYTLGFVTVIDIFALYTISLTFFLVLYVIDIFVAIVAVNGIMRYLKARKKKNEVAS